VNSSVSEADIAAAMSAIPARDIRSVATWGRPDAISDLPGRGALKKLDPKHTEIVSMRTGGGTSRPRCDDRPFAHVLAEARHHKRLPPFPPTSGAMTSGWLQL